MTTDPSTPARPIDLGWARAAASDPLVTRASAAISPDRGSSRINTESFQPLLISLLERRPEPLRRYDQIHMVVADLISHIVDIAPQLEGKRIIFMGDSDGLVIGLAVAARLGLVPSPQQLILCDFDERVLRFTSQFAGVTGVADLVRCELYNVFWPLPTYLLECADAFHTNPPYGRYNGGRSVIAFVERCIAATKRGGAGIIVLANDPRYSWSFDVLGNVLQSLVSKHITPFEVLPERHHYHLDDAPELASGLIRCCGVHPEYALSPRHALPESFRQRFYGRRTIPIPERIPLDQYARQLVLSV
jgi:hypothetical protein